MNKDIVIESLEKFCVPRSWCRGGSVLFCTPVSWDELSMEWSMGDNFGLFYGGPNHNLGKIIELNTFYDEYFLLG